MEGYLIRSCIGSITIKMAPTMCFINISDVSERWVISKMQKEMFTFHWEIDSGVAGSRSALFSGG